MPLEWIKASLGVAAALSMAAPFAPSAMATQTEKPTQFVPEGHKGMVCMAIAPQCMTKKQWAAHCLSNKNGSANLVPNSKSKLIDSQSCRDALDQSAPNADS